MADKKEKKHVSLKELQETVAAKKQEAKEIEAQSAALAEENNVPVEMEPDALPQGEKFLSAIGYISFLCILPLVLKPQSAFCQFHGKQGLILLVFFLIFGWVLSAFFGLLFGASTYVVAHNMGLLIHVIFAVIGMLWAFKGESKKLPLFGNFVEKLDW